MLQCPRNPSGGPAVEAADAQMEVRDDERETERKRRGGDDAAELLGLRNTIYAQE